MIDSMPGNNALNAAISQHQVSYTATPTLTNLTFFNDTFGNSYSRLDNVSVTAVRNHRPLPAWPLGMKMLVYCRRREM